MKNTERQSRRLLLFTLMLLAYFSGSCTTLKMASLFTSGNIETNIFAIEVPLRFRQELLHLDVRLNGKEPLRRFVFDTGAAFCVVSPELASELGLPREASDTASDSTGRKNKVDFVVLDSVEIGGLLFRNIAAAVVSLKNSQGLRCYDFQGVIGANLIRLAESWQIDYRKEKLRVSDQAKSAAGTGGGFLLPMRRNIQRIPEVEIRFFENRALWLEWDSGSTGGLDLNSADWKKLTEGKPQIPSVRKIGIYSAGAFGVNTAESRVAKIEELRLGDFRAGDQLVESNPETKSRVGNTFLRNYRITVNWSKNEMWLEPYIPEPGPAELITYGFGYDYDQEHKGIRVSLLYEKSAAFEAGLKIGDRIISINGTSLDSVVENEYCRFKADPTALFGDGEEIRIVVRRETELKECKLKKTRLL